MIKSFSLQANDNNTFKLAPSFNMKTQGVAFFEEQLALSLNDIFGMLVLMNPKSE